MDHMATCATCFNFSIAVHVFCLCVLPQVVYQESDSEAEVEIVDAAAGVSSDGEDDYTTDEGDDQADDDMSGDDVNDDDSSEAADRDSMDEDGDADNDDNDE
jgi:hypothetical protein